MKKLMIVDDSAFMRMILRRIVIKEGHQVICEAANGKEAILKYKEFNPEIVLMDVTMPDVNGLRALMNIKHYDQGAKVIMCSSLGNRFIIKEALELGAIDFIIKPPKEELLIEVIRKSIS